MKGMAVSLCGALSPVEGHSSSPKLYKAVENFMPSHDGELGLRQGDVVSSVKELGNGWSLGRNDNADSKVGIFPSRYVRPLPTFVAIPKVPLAVHRGDVSDEKRARRSSGRRKVKEIDELNLNLSVCNDAEKVAVQENYLEHEPPALTEQDRVRSKATSPTAKRLHPHTKDLANSFSVTEPDSVISTPRRGREFVAGQKPHMIVKPNQDKLFDESFERIDDVPPTSQDDVSSNYQRLNSWRDQVEDQLFLPDLSQRLANAGLSNGRSTSLLDLPARCDSLGTPLALLPSGAMPPSLTLMDLDVSQQQDYYSVDQSPTAAAAVATPMRRFGRPPPTETKRFCVDYRALTATTASSSAVDLSSSNSTGVRHKAILKPRNQRVADSNAQHVYYADNTNGHNKSCRLVACVSTGLTIGVLVFFWMFYHMDYNYTVSAIFAIILTVLLCLLLSLSRMVRCVAALLLPSLCTARGRAAFTVFLFGFLLSGPVGNIYVNMAEISRSMSCSAEQSYRQTILLLEPFDAMMDQLNRTIVSLQDAAHNVSRGLEPLDHGLERVELDVYNGNIQLYGTRKTCKNLVDRAFNACDVGMKRAQSQCLGVMGALGKVYHHAKDVLDKINPDRWGSKQPLLLKKRQVMPLEESGAAETINLEKDNSNICEPLDTVLVCHSLNDSDTLCQPSKWAGEAIHEAINATQTAMRSLHGALRFYVNSDPYNRTRVNASKVVFQIRQKVQEEFAYRTSMFHMVVDVLKKLVPVSLVWLVAASYLHLKYYMCQDAYDNTYVGDRMAELDQKRMEVTGECLLPLKKYERRYLIDTTSSQLSSEEENLCRAGLCVVTLSVIISLTCYLFDYVLYWVLSVVERNGRYDLDVTGSDSLDLVVSGDGIIAELLDIFLKGFHPGRWTSFQSDANACLPSPRSPSIANLVIVVMLHLSFSLLVLLKAYVFRLRNRLTGVFYPEREKARIVHLYGVILNQRRRLSTVLQHTVRAQYQQQQLREALSLRSQMNMRCRGGRGASSFRRQTRCLACGCAEDPNFHDCDTDRCRGLYCHDCYEDLERTCPLCLYGGGEYVEDEETEDTCEDGLRTYCVASKLYL